MYSCLFFKQMTAYEMRISYWSSDVCSSDLLSTALSAWGAQSDRQLVFAPDLISGKQSKGVSGRYGAEDALTQLLVGTGLTWERVNGQSIAIKRASAPAAEPRAKAPSAPAAAQSDEPKAQDLEQITLTGTRIRAGSPPSPGSPIHASDIPAKGFTPPAEVIRTLPH